jgi:hypothetical protein
MHHLLPPTKKVNIRICICIRILYATFEKILEEFKARFLRGLRSAIAWTTTYKPTNIIYTASLKSYILRACSVIPIPCGLDEIKKNCERF